MYRGPPFQVTTPTMLEARAHAACPEQGGVSMRSADRTQGPPCRARGWRVGHAWRQHLSTALPTGRQAVAPAPQAGPGPGFAYAFQKMAMAAPVPPQAPDLPRHWSADAPGMRQWRPAGRGPAVQGPPRHAAAMHTTQRHSTHCQITAEQPVKCWHL